MLLGNEYYCARLHSPCVAIRETNKEKIVDEEHANGNDEIVPVYEPMSPSELLALKDVELLTLYASHPNTSSEDLRILARRDDLSILRAVAGNPNTPVDVLDELARTSYVSVRSRTACNPSALPETLTWLLARSFEERSDDWKECRFNVLSNPHTPVSHILEKLLDNLGERSRLAIRMNTSFKSVYAFAQEHDERLLNSESLPSDFGSLDRS